MDSPEKINYEAGILDDPHHPRMLDLADFTCEICYRSTDDISPATSSQRKPTAATARKTMSTAALACMHRFCVDCYKTYLEQKIKFEGESRRIQCMEEKCNIIMDEKTLSLVVDKPVFER